MTYEPNIQAKSPLFRFPRELRDQIWDYALHGTEVHVLKENHVITIVYPCPNLHTDPEPDVSIPRWLLASKQTLAEGLEQFSRTSACTRVALHEKPWSCTFAPLAISRENLLLSQVRNMTVHLQISLFTNAYDERVDGPSVAMAIAAGPQGNDDAHLPRIWKCGSTVHKFLPNLQNLHLRLEQSGLERAPPPKHLHVNAMILRCLGTEWKRVQISILKPQLYVHYGEKDGDEPSHIASMARTYPRLQMALVMLGGHLMRHLGRLPPALAGEQWPSAEYRESGYWHVSEVDMHPCEEYEASEYDNVERWFKMADSINAETGEWTVEIEEQPGKGEIQCWSKVLRHTGLRDWSQAPQNLWGRIREEQRFKRDDVAKVGEHASWTCKETGRVVWIEDKKKAVTGYMDVGDDGQQQRRLRQPHPQPQSMPRHVHIPFACRMPSNVSSNSS